MKFSKVYPLEDRHTVATKLYSPNSHCYQLIVSNKTHTTISSSLEFFKKNSYQIEENLREFGSVLLRGFPVADAKDFGAFIEKCFEQWSEHRYHDAITTKVRNQIVPRVYSLQGQTTSSLIFHHEQSYLQQFPGKMALFCVSPAKWGGETGLSYSNAVVKEMEEKFPVFTAKLEKEGVRYFVNMLGRDAPELNRRSWQNTFGTTDKKKAEEILKKSGYTCKWIEKPGEEPILRATSDIRPGIMKYPSSGAKLWFNTTSKHWMNAVDDASVNQHYGDSTIIGPKTEDIFVFGNGDIIEPGFLEFANQLMEKYSFNVEWEAGDILLFDNLQMMHARREGTDGRKLFATHFK